MSEEKCPYYGNQFCNAIEFMERAKQAEAEVKELQLELHNVKTPRRCMDAEMIKGKCRGYQRSRVDDEPSGRCKTCKKFELYEESEKE